MYKTDVAREGWSVPMGERDPDPDTELVTAWQAGSLTPEQFEALARRVHQWICSRNGRLRFGDVAEDLTSQTILRVQRKLYTFRGDAKFFTWVIEFAKRVMFEHYEKQNRETPVAPEIVQQMVDGPAPDRPDEEAMDQMAVDEACANALTPHERDVFLLWWKEHIGPKAIAERLGITPNAAQLARKKATAKVYHYLKEQDWI